MCQCPQRASTHFYLTIAISMSLTRKGVNALNGLLLISTLEQVQEWNFHQRSVNALNGLLLISTRMELWWLILQWRCQCPQRASTHFYNRRRKEKSRAYCVSMPSTGFYSFLPPLAYRCSGLKASVNALTGLLLISTRKEGKRWWII